MLLGKFDLQLALAFIQYFGKPLAQYFRSVIYCERSRRSFACMGNTLV